MTPGVYVAGCEPATGKSAVALGVQQLLARRVRRLGVFRPVIADPQHDPLLDLLRPSGSDFLPYEASCGVGYEEVRADEPRALEEIVARYRALAAQCDGVLVVGTDYAHGGTASELAFNARVALNLGLPALLVVSGHERTPDEVATAISVALTTWRRWGSDVIAVVANRVRAGDVGAIAAEGELPVYTMPEVTLLMAPTVSQVAAACDGEVLAGDGELLGREALQLIVAAMTLPNLMERITDGSLLITPGDRADVLLAAIFAHASTALPSPAGVVLTGGLRPPEPILQSLGSFTQIPPIILCPHNTYDTVTLAGAREGVIARDAPRKITKALAVFETHVDGDDLLDRIDVARSDAVTPLMFEYTLLDQARSKPRRIVLPEAGDERVLRAADILLRRRVVELTLLGPEEEVRGNASRLGLDLFGAHVLDPADPELIERFAAEYAQRRAHKGVTVDQARDIVSDVSYFGTLMVALGMVDGMVSGATHTTAETIRPAFELVKTRPDVSIVSSVFLMCLADHVLVYGDCAVNPQPTAEQLADIAISSSETAAQFGIEPRVAMLSYSTGMSGTGADVERVRQATELVRARAPELSVEGPIQYDAAVDAGVARTKLPESSVAGRATVFIFPDLNTGNNTYKAVQRSANAIAIGPVLQGLSKPVNDLSRGATVHDIVNTVAITAIQAQ
jgi:phosphate acetyltransferase